MHSDVEVKRVRLLVRSCETLLDPVRCFFVSFLLACLPPLDVLLLVSCLTVGGRYRPAVVMLMLRIGRILAC